MGRWRPFGRGKRFGGNTGKRIDTGAGGWQLSGCGTWATTGFTRPAGQFPTGSKSEVYGTKHPFQDCRVGRCLSGYLWYNAYLNPAQINVPNGIMGIPSNYKPAFQNLIPFPEKPVPGDPSAPFYGTNTVYVPPKGGTVYRGDWDGIFPLQNQYVEYPGLAGRLQPHVPAPAPAGSELAKAPLHLPERRERAIRSSRSACSGRLAERS